MTVYIDDMFRYPMGEFRRMKMSHMIADVEDELHAMAARIGIKRQWYQGDHYDVSKSCRALAVRYGAVEIPLRTLSAMSMCRRNGYGLPTPDIADVYRDICQMLRRGS